MKNIVSSLRLGHKIGGGFGLILLLMALVSIVVWLSINALVSSAKWVNHTYEVIRTAESVGAAMVDMETGQRGFMITGDDEYLEPYYGGLKSFSEQIEKGRNLTSDNPAQVARWDAVKALKEQWVSEAAEPEITLRRKVTKGVNATHNFKEISSRTIGKEIFDSIRAALGTLEQKVAGNTKGQYLVTATTLALVNMETGQRGFLLSGKEESLEPYHQGSKDLKKHLSELRGRVNSSDLKRVQDRVDLWMEKAANPEIEARREMNKHNATIEDVAKEMKSGSGKTLMDATRAKLKEIIDEEEVLIDVRASEQNTTSSVAINTSIFGTLIAIVIGLAVAYFVTRGVLAPVQATNNILRDIAEGEGDLTIRVPVSSNDEIGELAGNFNAFVEKLQGIIGKITGATSQLATSAEELSAVTEQTNSAIYEQKQQTEQVASAINEMSATVQEVARSAEQASNSASTADNDAKTGNQVVSETVSSITGLANEIEKSASVIEKLKGDSENIGAILDVIKDIAEQTNLLALNAAIEAARAGEQGRGFAVVADEVRTLASRTQESTSEIETLINALQNGANEAVSAMSHSRELAENTVDKAQNAGASLSSITSSVSNILQVNTHIATASEEQSAVAEEINRNVTSIQTISEQTASGANQTTNASSELAKLSEELQTLVGQFKI